MRTSLPSRVHWALQEPSTFRARSHKRLFHGHQPSKLCLVEQHSLGQGRLRSGFHNSYHQYDGPSRQDRIRSRRQHRFVAERLGRFGRSCVERPAALFRAASAPVVASAGDSLGVSCRIYRDIGLRRKRKSEQHTRSDIHSHRHDRRQLYGDYQCVEFVHWNFRTTVDHHPLTIN